MCMADDADRVTLLSESEPRARKEYKCAECSRTIKIGEQYQSDRYLFDGRFSIHRTCMQCMVCREWLQKECSGWLYGGIYEDLAEHFHEAGYPAAIKWGIGRLLVGMQNKWAFKQQPRLPKTTFDEGQGAAEADGMVGRG